MQQMLSNYLPDNLVNIINQYLDEKVFIRTINKTNHLSRDQVLADYFKDVEIKYIANFKLAYQLSQEYFKVDDNKISLDALIGIFTLLSEHYSYDELLDPISLQIVREFRKENIATIGDLIDRLAEYLKKMNYLDFQNLNLMRKILGSKLYLEASKYCLAEDTTLNILFSGVYNSLLGENPDIYITDSWLKHKELYIMTLENIINPRKIIKTIEYKACSKTIAGYFVLDFKDRTYVMSKNGTTVYCGYNRETKKISLLTDQDVRNLKGTSLIPCPDQHLSVLNMEKIESLVEN